MKYIKSIKTINNSDIPVFCSENTINRKELTREKYYKLGWLSSQFQKDAVEKDFERFNEDALNILI